MSAHDANANAGVYAVPFCGTQTGGHAQHVRQEGDRGAFTLTTGSDDSCVAVASAGQARAIYDGSRSARTLVADGGGQNASGLYAMGGRYSTATETRRKIKAGELRVRRLTPLECERVQGFPDDWTRGVRESARYRLVGNSVMPPIVEDIGRMMS